MNGDELFSRTISTVKRKYFIDIKKAKNGSKYLVISEQTIGDTPDKNERHRVMVFDENLDVFMKGLDEARQYLKT